MWAKVKRRCRAMLRFIRSLRNSRGEWRGEFRGEPQGDILGDPQGEQDDWGFSWMAWGLLSGKEPASSELSQGASLILLFIGLIKLLLIYSAALSVLTGSPVRPSQSSSILSEEKLLSPLVMIHFILTDTCESWESSFFSKHCRRTRTWVQEWALPSAVSSVYIALSSG